MKTIISTDKAPKAIGPYSQGTSANNGNIVFVSGQLPIDPLTNTMPNDITSQTRQSLTNVSAILEAKGFTMKDVCKTTVYLKNIADFAAMNEVYATFFPEEAPARSAFEVANLPKDALVEIEVIAVK